jgi:hypothetical protein
MSSRMGGESGGLAALQSLLGTSSDNVKAGLVCISQAPTEFLSGACPGPLDMFPVNPDVLLPGPGSV